MSKLIANVSTWAGALFHHLAGAGGVGTDSAGFVAVNKIAFGPDQATPTVVDGSKANAFPVAPLAAVPDTVFTATTLDPTAVGNLVAVTPGGNGTVIFHIGTTGTAFPGGTVIQFEIAGVPGATPVAVHAVPRGAANSGRIKTTGTGGEFKLEGVAGAALVQARVVVAGTGSPLAFTAQIAAPVGIVSVAPTNVGQTTRLWNEAAAVIAATSATINNSGPIAASEVELHAAGSALWYTRVAAGGTAPTSFTPFVTPGWRRIVADDSRPIQCVPLDTIYVAQDTAPGHAVFTPAA